LSGGDCAVNPFVGYLVQELAPLGYMVGAVRNGLDGMVKENPADSICPISLEMAKEMPYWPSFEFGSTRRSLKEDPSDPETKTALKNIQENCGFVIQIGGNDHLYEGKKLGELLEKAGINCIVLGTPKTIDGDTLYTQPLGIESGAQKALECVYRAAAVPGSKDCVIIEVMGRDCGVLTARAGDKRLYKVLALLPKELHQKAVLSASTLESYVPEPEHCISIKEIRRRAKEKMQKVKALTYVISEGFRLPPSDPDYETLLKENPALKELVAGAKTDAHGNIVIPKGMATEFMAEILKEYNPVIEVTGFTPRGAIPNDEERLISKAFAANAKRAITERIKGQATTLCDDLRYPDELGKIGLVAIDKACGKDAQGKSKGKNIDNVFTPEELKALGVIIEENQPIEETLPVDQGKSSKNNEAVAQAVSSTAISANKHKRPSVFFIAGTQAEDTVDNIFTILKQSPTQGVVYVYKQTKDSFLILSKKSAMSLGDFIKRAYTINRQVKHLNVIVSEGFLIAKDDELFKRLTENKDALGQEIQALKGQEDTLDDKAKKKLSSLKQRLALFNELALRLKIADISANPYYEFSRQKKTLGRIINLVLLLANSPDSADKPLSDVRLTSLARALDNQILSETELAERTIGFIRNCFLKFTARVNGVSLVKIVSCLPDNTLVSEREGIRCPNFRQTLNAVKAQGYTVKGLYAKKTGDTWHVEDKPFAGSQPLEEIEGQIEDGDVVGIEVINEMKRLGIALEKSQEGEFHNAIECLKRTVKVPDERIEKILLEGTRKLCSPIQAIAYYNLQYFGTRATVDHILSLMRNNKRTPFLEEILIAIVKREAGLKRYIFAELENYVKDSIQSSKIDHHNLESAIFVLGYFNKYTVLPYVVAIGKPAVDSFFKTVVFSPEDVIAGDVRLLGYFGDQGALSLLNIAREAFYVQDIEAGRIHKLLRTVYGDNRIKIKENALKESLSLHGVDAFKL
ncbi:MAG: 6-phosphofructokinase, partial [Candidatus Omnitrophota bacterium]